MHPKQPSKQRRTLLKVWIAPTIASITLPQHAQASPQPELPTTFFDSIPSPIPELDLMMCVMVDRDNNEYTLTVSQTNTIAGTTQYFSTTQAYPIGTTATVAETCNASNTDEVTITNLSPTEVTYDIPSLTLTAETLPAAPCNLPTVTPCN